MRNKLLSLVLATILVLFGTVIPVSAETVNGTNATSRIVGQDHYQTSVAIAEAYNNNGDCGNVILASADSFPDALSASILSKKLNAPILLVGTTVNASSDAFNYLYTHESRQRGTVYIIGGTGVIGPDFETKLASMMFTNIKRLGGTDRYDTNMLIVNEVNVPQGTPVLIASGENFPDALSISSFSGSKQYPTLLVGADYLPEKTKSYLIDDQPSAVYITGGNSVVSQDLESQINALVPGATVTRLAGDDRFGTNAAVLKEFSPAPAPDTIYLANGDDFQDVLAGSALAAKTGNPIMLLDNQLTNLPPATEAYLKILSGSGIQPNVIALGGPDVISDKIVKEVQNTLDEKPQKIVHSRITFGTETAYYLDSSGHVWAWGDGGSGQLGNGTWGTQLNTINNIPIYGSTVPVEVSDLSNIVTISAGGSTCYALDSSGHVWAWEYLSNSLINGQTSEIKITPPAQVSNLFNIVAITGRDENYALDSTGHVWAWGEENFGELGNGTTTENQTPPVLVSDISNITEIAAGSQSGYALDSSGNVWAWGKNNFGQLGDGTTRDSSTSVKVQGLPK